MIDYRELFDVSELSASTNAGEGVKVAVIDTGIPSIDDIFVCYTANLTSEGVKDNGHATFIGSMLFGTGPILGICRNATACFIKVFEKGTVRPETVARAINHAVDFWDVDIINLSLGFSRKSAYPDSLKKACKKAFDRGVTLVAAAGNDGGRALWPAALPEVISVGSATHDSKETFSNSGEVDFVVPGRDLYGQNASGQVVKKTGTSFSAALVTGLAALLYARMKNEHIEPLPVQVKRALIDSCKDLGPSGWDQDTGFGFPLFRGRRNRKSIRLSFSLVFDKIKALIKKAIIYATRRITDHE